MSWNCRGIINLGTQSILIDYVCKNRLHVVALQETHLNGQSLYIPNYKIYRRDRNNNGGGVALLIRKDIIHTYISCATTLEGSWHPAQLSSISHGRGHPTSSFVCPVSLDRPPVRPSTSHGVFLSFCSRTWRPLRCFWCVGCRPSFQDDRPIVCG